MDSERQARWVDRDVERGWCRAVTVAEADPVLALRRGPVDRTSAASVTRMCSVRSEAPGSTNRVIAVALVRRAGKLRTPVWLGLPRNIGQGAL